MHRYRFIILLSMGVAWAAGLTALSTSAAAQRAQRNRSPVGESQPRISGTAQTGYVLQARPGRWSGASRFTYHWQFCNARIAHCRLIERATHRPYSRSTYRLTSKDVGHRLRLVVIAWNRWGHRTAASRMTAVITKAGSPSQTLGSTAPSTPTPTPLADYGLAGLHVSGNQVLDQNGHVVYLHGVNRSGTEYACVQGWGIFDGPSDAASVAAMASWHINIVRIPLNEDCWLGINGVRAAYSGQSYINAIVNYVSLLHHYGMRAELSLMWGAPGGALAGYQPAAPDEDHSPAMWRSMAQTFKNDPNVILAPWGETSVDWPCFLNGCSNEATFGSDQDNLPSCGSNCWYYNSAGMQQAVTVMRQTGYSGPISIPCIALASICADPVTGGTGWGNGNWLTDHPNDPDHQLIAEAHVYGKTICDTTLCLNTTMLPILRAGYPMIWGETGETYDYSDCPSTSFTQVLLGWAEQNGVGTEVWSWDTWGQCSTGSLISNYDGTPEDPYGSYVKSNYQTVYGPPHP